MSNKKQQQQKEQQQANNKVKSVRLYKIGGYQQTTDDEDDYETNYDPRYAYPSRPRVQFNDPREYYFNPYQFGPYMPPGSYTHNFPPVSDFSYQRKRNIMPAYAKQLKNQYSTKPNNYYDSNNFAPYPGPSGYLPKRYNQVDEEEEENDDEDEDNDGDDEEADQNTEEDEDDEGEDEENEDEEEEEEEEKVEQIELNKNDAKSKKVEPKPEEIKKDANTIKKERTVSEPILKQIIDSATNPPLKQQQLLQPSNPAPSPSRFQPTQTPKSILVTENKLPVEENQTKNPIPVIRMMPIKATTKKVVKITTAEVVDAPYKFEKPMSPESKAKFLRKSSIESTKSNEDVTKNETNEDSKKNEETKLETPVPSENVEQIEELPQAINENTPIEDKNEMNENLSEEKVNENLQDTDQLKEDLTRLDDEIETNKIQPELKEDLTRLDDEIETNKFQPELKEDDSSLYDKDFKMNEIETLPTITEATPVSNVDKSNHVDKNKKLSNKKNEPPKPAIRKQVVPPPLPRKSNEKLNKRSFVLAKPKLSEKLKPDTISIPKVNKTVKEIHNFIEHKNSDSKLDDEREEKEDEFRRDSIDSILLKERENSTFFGKIGKLEVPNLVSTSITPSPPIDQTELSDQDHDQRINDIIEENRSDFFKIEAEQFFQEEVTKLKTPRRGNTKAKKNRKKKSQGLPNKFTSQFLLERAYSDLKLNKSNLPSLANLEDKYKDFKIKSEDEELKNDIKFPSLIMSEKPEEYKSFTINGANHLNCRKSIDPGFKRCPCLMHNRLYYEEINNKLAADIESYEMRPCSVKDNFPMSNSNSDYQLIYGERYIGFIPHRLKSVNEVFLNEHEFSSHLGEFDTSFSKSNSHSEKILKQREPWNNVF